MGARSFRKSGGFLNNVNATLIGYEWTDEFDGKPYVPGKVRGADGKMKDKFHSLYFVLEAQADGAKDTAKTHLFAGDAEQWTISEDGHTITPNDSGYQLGDNTALSVFIGSLIEAGFPESNLSGDDVEDVNFEPIIGTRVRLVQRRNQELTQKLGQRKDKKTGKGYDRQDLVVDQVYDLPTAQAKSNGKPASNGKAAKPATKAAQSAPAEDTDIPSTATEALLRYLGSAKDNTLAKSKIRMKVLTDKAFTNQNELRDEIYKFLASDDNLEGMDGITYDRSDKAQLIALAE